MKKIEKSEFESGFLELNVYRSSDGLLPTANELKQSISENSIDLLRLKIDVQYEAEMNHVMFSAGFPFFYSHSVLNVIADYSLQEIFPYKNNDLTFEQYSADIPEHEKRFYNLVYYGMMDDPIGYHKTPLISSIISKEKEADCYASYYQQFYNGSQPNKIGFIMQKHGEDAGVFVFEIEGDTIYTSMAAVLPQFRSSGMFHDMKVFRQKYCNEHNITKAIAGSRLANFNTPNTLLKLGYRIFKAEHVFHIPALISFSEKKIS